MSSNMFSGKQNVTIKPFCVTRVSSETVLAGDFPVIIQQITAAKPDFVRCQVGLYCDKVRLHFH